MHTGYDNYWMYSNYRQKLIPNLPKNDNFNHPEITDSYKQVQTMGCPSNLYNYISPQNTVARPQPKVASNQHRVTNPTSAWLSSVYSVPFRPPHTNNYQLQEAFQVHPNTVYYPSENPQLQQSHEFGQMQNPNVNFSQISFKDTAGCVNGGNIENTEVESAKIRVRDVFSLSNNSIHNLKENGVLHTEQKKQNYYSINAASEKLNSDTQRENTHTLPQFNYSYQYYGSPATYLPFNNGQQYLHHSGSYYQKNVQYPGENQLCFTGVRQIQEFPPEPFNTPSSGVTNSATRQMLKKKIIQRTDVHNPHISSSVAQNFNESVTFKQKKNLSTSLNFERSSYVNSNPNENAVYELPKIAERNEHLSSITTRFQNPDRSEIAQSSRSSPVLLSSEQFNQSNANNPPHSRPEGQEISTILTIPYTGQKTILSLSDPCFTNTKESSLPVLLVKDNTTTTNGCDQIDTPVNEMMNLSPPEQNPVCSTYSNISDSRLNRINATQKIAEVDKKCTNERSVVDAVTSKENQNVFVDASENFLPESFGAQVCGSPDIYEVSVGSQPSEYPKDHQSARLGQAIKTKENLFTEESNQPPENLHNKLKSQPKNDETNFSLADTGGDEVKKPVNETSTATEPVIVIDGENEGTVYDKAPESDQETLPSGKKYKSEINRDKLIKLINFLKKEEGSIEKVSCKEKSSSKKENESKQNRRKMSKTRVVKNKNNGREMVSLISHKTPKSTSKSSVRKVESKETAGVRGGCGKKSRALKGSVLSEKVSLREKKSDTTKTGIPDEKLITPEETNIINIMRAFQKLKNHFCVSCDFSSPVESIWINVVSGELRCLSCFKKMMLKAEESHHKPIKSDAENNSNAEKKFKTEATQSLNFYDAIENTMDIKELVKRELFEGKKEQNRRFREEFKGKKNETDSKTGRVFREKNTAQKGKKLAKSSKDQSSKQARKEQYTSEAVCKHAKKVSEESKKRSEKPVNINERSGAWEKQEKKEAKGSGSGNQSRKRISTTEEFVPEKFRILEGLAMKSHSSDRDSRPECCNLSKEEPGTKVKKHDSSSKIKWLDQKPHKEEEASSRSEDGDMPKMHRKKRMSLDDEFESNKVCYLDEKLKTKRESKEENYKNKIEDGESGKFRKHVTLKEEESKKGTKQDVSDKAKRKDDVKVMSEEAKQKTWETRESKECSYQKPKTLKDDIGIWRENKTTEKIPKPFHAQDMSERNVQKKAEEYLKECEQRSSKNSNKTHEYWKQGNSWTQKVKSSSLVEGSSDGGNQGEERTTKEWANRLPTNRKDKAVECCFREIMRDVGGLPQFSV